jgi:hypothetical protein
MSKYRSGKNLTILAWGCGPGRIIRHMPDLFDESGQCHGTDYNFRSIAWCRENLPGIQFAINDLKPPLH